MAQPMKYQSNTHAIGRVSHLQRLWEDGGFAITVQLPPTSEAGDLMAQVAAQAKLFDAVVVADAPGGAVALSSLAMALLLKRVGIETLVQFNGRDRNRLALQSDLLSLGALGIPNLLVDMRPVVRASLIQNADARLVTDLDGPALLATAIRLRDEARFISGFNIKTPPALYIGAFFSLEEHIRDLNSAQFVVTTPVYDVHGFAAVLVAFQSAHPDFLQTRPLLVSLPLIIDSTVENSVAPGEVRETGMQKVASSIEVLKGLDGIRGFNIVVSEQTDLALLERTVRKANSNSVGRG
ncbi:MAG: hypothetical protein NVS4B11_14960 [Ktedonobacteraceae bacterium]